MKLSKFGDKAVSLNVKNDNVSIDYVLSDISVLPTVPGMKRLPDFGTQIKLDNNFVNTWNILDLESKSKLIGRLYELSEENSDLNFEKLFKLGLQSTDESIIYSSLEGLWESEGHDTLRRLIRLANTNLSPHVKGSVMTHISRFILFSIISF